LRTGSIVLARLPSKTRATSREERGLGAAIKIFAMAVTCSGSDFGHGIRIGIATADDASRLMTDFLTDTEVSVIRDRWASLRFPDEAARLKVLESDLVHIERTAKILQSYQHACSGPAIVAPASGRPTGSPYSVVGTGGIEGAARRARGG
jgi:hypothetical protein